MKIRNKVNLIFICGVILIILITGVVINIFSSNQLKKISQNFISGTNDSQAHEVSTFLKSQKEMSEILAAASVYRDFLKEPKNSSQYSSIKTKIDKRFIRTLEIDKNILELYILDSSGRVVASSDAEEEGEDRSKDLYFTEAKKDTYIKDPIFYAPYKSAVYSVSSPVFGDSGEFLGVSVLVFSLNNLYTIIQPTVANTETGENFLVNSKYDLLSPGRYLTNQDILNKKVETKNSKDCFSESEKSIDITNNIKAASINYTDYRGVNVVGTHHYIPETGWCLITKEDLSEALAPSTFLTSVIVIVSLLILGILIPISYYVTSKLTKSIILLQEGVHSIEAGDLNKKVSINTKDEVGELSVSFDRMVEAVKQSRKDVDKKVEEQTREIVEKQKFMEDQQKATLNILEDVEEEKTKVSALLSGVGEGVIATDNNTNVIFMNKSAEEMIGWRADEVVGKGLYEFLPITDEKGNLIDEEKRPFYIALNEKKKFVAPLQVPYYYIKKSGEKFPVSVTVTPVLLENKLIGAIDVFHDITHEKEVDKVKTEFVSLASHQLRTPLSTINWYTEMLLAGDAGKLNEEQVKFLKEIYAGNKRMVDLVNSLLNVSRLDLGTFSIEPEFSSLEAIAKQVVKEILPQMKEKNQIFTEEYQKKLPEVLVDKKLMDIIFQNLLSNAMKYTPEKGKINLSIKKDSENYLIEVSDTGLGIPKDSAEKIFTKLYRADNVRETDTVGTGLGLYMVKSILEQSGGKIWFVSEQNKGTTFFVSIPITGMSKKEGTKELT
jgi:PAS domain S-box-containing protein